MKKTSLRLTVLSTIGLLSAAAAHASVPLELVGEPAAPAQAQRTVVITPHTRWVNVHEGEVVQFQSRGQDFAFDFDGLPYRSFDLSRIAPAGSLDHRVRVYVGRSEDHVD